MLVALAHLTLHGHGSLEALEGDVCVEAMTMEEPPAPRASTSPLAATATRSSFVPHRAAQDERCVMDCLDCSLFSAGTVFPSKYGP